MTLFKGTATALITPFRNEKIDYPAMGKLVEWQLKNGVDALVVCGTTGEAPTLSDAEKLELFQRAKAYVGNDCKIIAGTGSNSTLHTLELSLAAAKAGVDGLLLVSPYYNKANPEGLYLHYESVARAVDLPIILYNVPSRTGLDMPVSVYQRLSQLPNIAGVKEASDKISKITHIRHLCGANLPVWSGNDDEITPAMALGASGVISVLSNVVPVETQAMAIAAFNGDFDTAAALQTELQPLVDALFSDVNPIPVKAAMKLIGYDCGPCRLPLGPLAPERELQIKRVLG